MTKTLNLLFFFFFPSVIFAQITFMQNNTTNKYQHPNAAKDMCIESWGKPTSVNKTTTAYSTHEQWVYKFGTGTRYLYFDNNKLTSFQ